MENWKKQTTMSHGRSFYRREQITQSIRFILMLLLGKQKSKAIMAGCSFLWDEEVTHYCPICHWSKPNHRKLQPTDYSRSTVTSKKNQSRTASNFSHCQLTLFLSKFLLVRCWASQLWGKYMKWTWLRHQSVWHLLCPLALKGGETLGGSQWSLSVSHCLSSSVTPLVFTPGVFPFTHGWGV